MQARLITRDIAKGNNATNREIAAQEISLDAITWELMLILHCHFEILVRHQDVMFAATAITAGDPLSGCH